MVAWSLSKTASAVFSASATAYVLSPSLSVPVLRSRAGQERDLRPLGLPQGDAVNAMRQLATRRRPRGGETQQGLKERFTVLCLHHVPRDRRIVGQVSVVIGIDIKLLSAVGFVENDVENGFGPAAGHHRRIARRSSILRLLRDRRWLLSRQLDHPRERHEKTLAVHLSRQHVGLHLERCAGDLLTLHDELEGWYHLPLRLGIRGELTRQACHDEQRAKRHESSTFQNTRITFAIADSCHARRRRGCLATDEPTGFIKGVSSPT